MYRGAMGVGWKASTLSYPPSRLSRVSIDLKPQGWTGPHGTGASVGVGDIIIIMCFGAKVSNGKDSALFDTKMCHSFFLFVLPSTTRCRTACTEWDDVLRTMVLFSVVTASPLFRSDFFRRLFSFVFLV